jgi:hypothetical protein
MVVGTHRKSRISSIESGTTKFSAGTARPVVFWRSVWGARILRTARKSKRGLSRRHAQGATSAAVETQLHNWHLHSLRKNEHHIVSLGACLPSTMKRLAIRTLGLALILAVSALGVHAFIHDLDSSSGQHCPVCHLSRTAAPLPTAPVTVQAPIRCSRDLFVSTPASDFGVVLETTSSRGPPA